MHARRLELAWANWYRQLDEFAAAQGGSPMAPDAFLERMGHEPFRCAISLVCREQPVVGYVAAIRVPDDVRILLRPAPPLRQATTLFHEIGHAVARAANREDGLYQVLTAAYDEGMAMLCERLGIECMLLPPAREPALALWRLEIVCLCAGFRFETELWREP